MKFKKLVCPNCGAGIDLDVKGKSTVFCPYCGTQLAIDDGTKTVNKNINIKEELNIHERYTNDAEVERERRIDRENERKHKESKSANWFILGYIIFLLALGLATFGYTKWKEISAINSGKIKVGISSEESEGKKYQGIMEQLKEAGFTNITTIDMDDAGLFTKRPDTIDSITIDGDSTFASDDYYAPDSKIIISYH